MLSSWKPRHPDPHLTLGVFYNTEVFTQQEYADLLRALGAIVEDWLREVQATEKGTSTSGRAPRLRYWVVIVLYDWEAQRVWWQAHLDASFPTWSKLGRLKVDYRTRKYNISAPPFCWTPIYADICFSTEFRLSMET